MYLKNRKNAEKITLDYFSLDKFHFNLLSCDSI